MCQSLFFNKVASLSVTEIVSLFMLSAFDIFFISMVKHVKVAFTGNEGYFVIFMF